MFQGDFTLTNGKTSIQRVITSPYRYSEDAEITLLSQIGISSNASSGSQGYNLVKPYSEKTAEVMDQEVKSIVKDVHDRTTQLIEKNKEGFMQLGALLLEKEVIFAEDIERILGPKVKPEADDQFVQDKEQA